MATLQSPGVEVTVIDESFYTPAEPGTTPLIVVATGQDKTNASNTGIAASTTKANAGIAFKVTSQRDLVDLFGVPFFEKTASSSPIHGSERNEYGLLAAYSLLGVSNAAFIVRADIDLTELEASSTAPGALPDNGDWWVDAAATSWGIQEWNGASADTVGGQKFTAKTPIVLTDDDSTKIDSGTHFPKPSVGVEGDYAVVFETGSAVKENARFFYKQAKITGSANLTGAWVLLGSTAWTGSHPTAYSSRSPAGYLTGQTYLINGVSVSGSGTGTAILTALAADINLKLASPAVSPADPGTGIFAEVINGKLYVYTKGVDEGDSTLSEAVVLENGTGNWNNLGINLGSNFTATSATFYGPRLQQTPHTQIPAFKSSDSAPRPTGSVWIKTTEPNLGSRWSIKQWNSASETWTTVTAPLYSSIYSAEYFLDRSGGGANINVGSLFVQTNAEEYSGDREDPGSATFRVWRRAVKGATAVTNTATSVSSGIQTFTISESQTGVNGLETVTVSTASLTGTTVSIVADLEAVAKAINDAAYNAQLDSGLKYVSASVVNSVFTLTHSAGGTIRITDSTGGLFGSIFGSTYDIYANTGTTNWYAAPAGADYDYFVTNWKPLAAQDLTVSTDSPLNEPADGQLWYNASPGEVDIMVHNGNTWVGLKATGSPYSGTDANGAIVSATAPTTQSDGTTALENNDLWVSTADLENYPTLYRYQFKGGDEEGWYLIDKADQTTEDGILFADARYGLSGLTGNTAASIADLLDSNYLDPDAPDPDLYPKGMLLWNLRRSSGNVKKYRNNYINTTLENARYDINQSPAGLGWLAGETMGSYATDRWVTASPNNEDGSGSFLRKAQRAVVVAAMKSAVDTSEEIRDEERRNFNLIAAPGYPELLSNLVNLNIDRGITAFVVGDTPLRLASDATTLTNWGTNAALVTDNGDQGIVTYDEYSAVFYPNGFTTDLSGTNAVVPASHMMLKTIALSDNATYPWFAPAGTRRGGITNATAVGYIQASTGEFQTVSLNEGQRDTLYDLKVNPITFFNGVGLVNYGQKTRARNASALDRINVARLVVYLRSQLNKLARPYIFEPNDKITRDEIKQAVESLLLELVGLRALYDFAVVCDETNNTSARIDRNELWVDIAIEPVKAVEFIYIPLRVRNTGEI